MNSAALRFVPAAELVADCYERYSYVFSHDVRAVSSGDDVSGGTRMNHVTGDVTTVPGTETAVLAGGCFWGLEDLIRRQPGVLATRVGYTGGENDYATYRNHPGHAEAIEILFDPKATSYREVLEFFFQAHDPTTLGRQGNDVGSSYRSAIFPLNPMQKEIAEHTISEIDRSGVWPGPVVTTIEPAVDFWEAEDVHQNYLINNPGGYSCHFVRADWVIPAKQ